MKQMGPRLLLNKHEDSDSEVIGDINNHMTGAFAVSTNFLLRLRCIMTKLFTAVALAPYSEHEVEACLEQNRHHRWYCLWFSVPNEPSSVAVVPHEEVC